MVLFRRSRPGRLLIAERFVAPCARLSTVVLPLDVLARQPLERLRLVLFAADGTASPRAATLVRPRLSPDEALRKLLWIQKPRLFRLLVAFNDRLPYRMRFVRNPTVTLR